MVEQSDQPASAQIGPPNPPRRELSQRLKHAIRQLSPGTYEMSAGEGLAVAGVALVVTAVLAVNVWGYVWDTLQFIGDASALLKGFSGAALFWVLLFVAKFIRHD